MTHQLRSRCLLVLLVLFWTVTARAGTPSYTWTTVVPENDKRAADMREFDESITSRAVTAMNRTEPVFHQQLTWQRVPLSHLLSVSAPFCELDFDAVKPMVLTAREKTVLREFFIRGGFLILSEDAYLYTREEIKSVKNWPAIDFVTKDLPASDPNFTVEKITEKHPIYHQYYSTKIPQAERNELKANPKLPDFTLVSYRGHPCAFVYANYFCDDEKWVPLVWPFPTDTELVPEDYALNVNLYIYVTMH